MDQPQRRELISALRDNGVSKLFCGHFHRDAGGWDGDDFEVVVTGAVGTTILYSDAAKADMGGATPLGFKGYGSDVCDAANAGLRCVRVGRASRPSIEARLQAGILSRPSIDRLLSALRGPGGF